MAVMDYQPGLLFGVHDNFDTSKKPDLSNGNTLRLPTHCIKSNVFTELFLLLYLVQIALCRMDNATPLRVKWTIPLPLHME